MSGGSRLARCVPEVYPTNVVCSYHISELPRFLIMTEQASPAAFTTHDPACERCRAKKIRCGRERPTCNNCRRDGVICDFSNRAKRMNYNKLL